ncbi:MAG: type II secretion system GspH family protein [Chloracidobacterium sp.]|nr:type II secretion system GspH family protein [Chloracidobacterium sp.]MDW8218258.1 type II secretion system protein [Acidobacteriota bacterium]
MRKRWLIARMGNQRRRSERPCERFDQQRCAGLSEVGSSLLEMIITLAILAVLTSAALPLARTAARSRQEAELRRALREIRFAIDRYKEFHDQTGGQRIPVELRTTSGYPKKLEVLYEGFVPAGNVDGKKIFFLRRLPIDPMTGKADWQTRSSTGDPDSALSSGDDVFDVRSRSTATALDGTRYNEW